MNKSRFRLNQLAKCLLAFIVIVAGFPLVSNLPKTFAETSVNIDPPTISSVYHEQTEVTFSFDDSGEITSHDTNIDLEQNETKIATLESKTYPTKVDNLFKWDGSVNGKPVQEGSYQISVIPDNKFSKYGGSGDIQIVNPAPPRPTGLKIEPNKKGNSFTIRGIAELGTKIELRMKTIKRVGDNTTVDDGIVKIVETKPAVISVDTPITPGKWDEDLINSFFPADFPARDDNKPEDYIGEWEAEIELPPYEIAEIQAFSTRDLDKKRSEGSKPLRVLHYVTPAWNINWAVIASYYYNLIDRDALVKKVGDIAKFNGFPEENCNEGTCYGNLEKDIHLLLMDPEQAGIIGQDDEARIKDEYANRNGHPIAEQFDPINLATGDFSFRQTNLEIPAVIPLDLTLTYHSRDGYDGDFGVGWHHTYERRLEFYENGVIYVVSPEGASHRYEPIGNGQYKAPLGMFDTLVKNPDGTYTQQTPQKWTYTFRKDGKLYRITDTNGNTVQMTYQGTLLTEVATDGAKLSFTYGDGGKVVRVTDQSSRSASYEYDPINHDLTAMILPDGARISYKYDEKHRLVEIRNPNETMPLVNEYDAEDRVVRQRDFAGTWGEIAYAPEKKQTVTTDALGRKTVYQYDDRYRKTGVTYPDGTSEQYEYDKDDNLIQMTDRNGYVWEYMYDNFGNLIRSIDPEGYQTEIRYNDFQLPVEITDPLGNKTHFAYDGRGNLTSVIDPLGGISSITVNRQGIPESIVNVNGEVTTIESDAQGFARSIVDPLGNRQELIRDPLHRVIEVVDALGQNNKLEYDQRDRLVASIDALGQKETYAYDKDSNLVGFTDKAGSKTVYEYDSYARLSAETDALGATTRYFYDAVGNLIKQVDANGAETVYTYDDNNRVASVTDPEGNVSEYEYDGNGNLVRAVQPNSGVVTIEYDKRNLPVKYTDEVGAVSLYHYDAAGRLTQETDPLGNKTEYDYDALGQLSRSTDALGQATTYAYDGNGNLLETVQPNGAKWRFDYDERGLLVKTTDPLGHMSEMRRDALGRVIESVDEAGKTTTYTYDPLDRVTRMTDPLGRAIGMDYNALDQLTSLTDAKGQVTAYGYDRLGRLLQVTNALGNTTAYGYDAIGNLVTKTDALGRLTAYQYNRNSELIRETGPEQRVTELAYDGMGNVTGMTAPDGTLTSYAYDLASRLTGIRYPDGKQVGYEYDAAGRRTRMLDDIGSTTYTYDELNRLTSVKDPYNRVISYEWTLTGQRGRITYPDMTSVSYSYDLLDRITAVTDAEGRTTSYDYDERGLLVSKRLPTLGGSEYRYDDAGQLLELTHRNQYDKILEQLTYAYDPAGNVIRSERRTDGNDEDDADGSDSPDALVTEYAYDAINQLIQVQMQNTKSGDPSVLTNYNYDAVGNRLEKTSVWGDLTETESYTYDAADLLLKMVSSTEINDYVYDLRGNLLKVIQQRLQLPEELLSVTEQAYGKLPGIPDSGTEMNNTLPDIPDIDDIIGNGTGDLTDLNDVIGNATGDELADPSVTEDVYGLPQGTELDPLQLALSGIGEWSDPKVVQQYEWDGAGRLIRQINEKGDITSYLYDGDDNRMQMIVDYAHGGRGNGNGNGNGNDNGNGIGNGNGNGNGNGLDKCKVVPPGFIPPGLAKKCGQYDEPYPDMHPGGPRDGWEKQYKKTNWEITFTNDISLALPEPLQATEADGTPWKESYVYGAGGERLSMTYLPAYDPNNGWEPTPGEGGAEPDAIPKTLWYMQDAIGTTIGMVEKDGRVSSRYHYDEFGIPLDAKKFDLNWPGPDNLFGYTGLGYDYTSGLSYARARYYEPEIGRFVSEDTYRGTLGNPQSQNLYTYVENNPVAYVDPSGNFCVSPDGKDAHLGQCNRSDPTKYYVPDFMVNAFPYLRDGIVYGYYNLDMNKPGYQALKTPYYSTFWEASGISKADYFEQWVLAIPLAGETYTAGSTHVPINGLKIPKSSGGKKSNAPKSNTTQGTGALRSEGKPYEIHTTVQKTDIVRNLPTTGKPNSSVDLYNENGTLMQRRYYDENGRAVEDIDYEHSNGDNSHVFPHRHTWDWSSGTSKRSK